MDKDLIYLVNLFDKNKYHTSDDSDFEIELNQSSKRYLQKYWLDYDEMTENWFPIMNHIFKPDAYDLPELIFNEEFELQAQLGGTLFTRDEFISLQKCMKVAGDTHFVLIETKPMRKTYGLSQCSRFKYPVEISWEDLNNGDEDFPDAAFHTINLMDYYVFGDSCMWGKYTANGYRGGLTPLEIIGYKPQVSDVFRKHFEPTGREKKTLREWLPPAYKKLIPY